MVADTLLTRSCHLFACRSTTLLQARTQWDRRSALLCRDNTSASSRDNNPMDALERHLTQVTSAVRVRGALQRGWLPALLVAFLLAFFVAPIGQMALYGFYTYHPFRLMDRDITLTNYLAIVRDPYISGILIRTLRLAAIATLLSAGLGYIVATRMRQARGLEKMNKY